MHSNFRKWAAYEKGFALALAINEFVKTLPRFEERKLADQICRSSRSVCSNLGESCGKRRYPKHFLSKISDAVSENFETQVWLDFARANQYISEEKYKQLIDQSEEVGRILSWMERNSSHFIPRSCVTNK